jgi:hypothetical protein
LRNFIYFFIGSVFFACGTAPGRKAEVKEHSTVSSFTDTTKKNSPALENNFRGTIRSDVKTSFVKFPADTFESVKKLRNWLPADEYMHKSTEAKRNNSPRTEEESHNVYLKDIWLFGVKREDDNDFHLIIGSSKSLDKDQPFFTAEISGLPDSADEYFSTLAAVRNELVNYFGDDSKKEFVFVASKKDPPIHLDFISGSLFFDNHHYSAHSKIQNYKVCSAWEIHPVTQIHIHGKR